MSTTILPEEILFKITAAETSLRQDIARVPGDAHADLDWMLRELDEMRQGTRKQTSSELRYLMMDSMDWNLPSFRKFSEAADAVRRHYRIKI